MTTFKIIFLNKILYNKYIKNMNSSLQYKKSIMNKINKMNCLIKI